MGTSSSLEIRYQGKTAFRYSSYDGHRPTVMGALLASVATVGLDNVRAGFLAQKSVNPEEGESEHVSEYGDVSPQAWAAARDTYALCAMGRGREPWGLANLMFRGEEHSHGHPYMGALFALAPEMSNDVGMAGNDYVLDLDTGRAGAWAAPDRWLWIDLSRGDYLDPDVACAGIQEWFGSPETGARLRALGSNTAGPETDAVLATLQASLDAQMAGLEGVAPEPSQEHPDQNMLAGLQAMATAADVEGEGEEPEDLSESQMPPGHVVFLRAPEADNFGLFLAATAWRAVTSVVPALAAPMRVVPRGRELLLAWDTFSPRLTLRNAQSQVIKALGERLAMAGVFPLALDTAGPGMSSSRHAGGGFAQVGAGGIFGGKQTALPSGGKVLATHAALVVAVAGMPEKEQIENALCALAALDPVLFAAASPTAAAEALAQPELPLLLQTVLPALAWSVPGYIPAQFERFSPAVQEALREAAGPAAEAVFLPAVARPKAFAP